MDEKIGLAKLLKTADVKEMGLETAVTFLNAPNNRNTTHYWLTCVHAYLRSSEFPTPHHRTSRISSNSQLQDAEDYVKLADLYLWLGNRDAFQSLCNQTDGVRAERLAVSKAIDEALVARINTARRCKDCGQKLPLTHKHAICNNCYESRRPWRDDEWY